jgi:hypothetical protein
MTKARLNGIHPCSGAQAHHRATPQSPASVHLNQVSGAGTLLLRVRCLIGAWKTVLVMRLFASPMSICADSEILIPERDLRITRYPMEAISG